MLFLLAPLFRSSGLRTLTFDGGRHIGIVQFAKFVFEGFFESALSVVGGNSLFGIGLGLLHRAGPEDGRPHLSQRVLFNQLLELLRVGLLCLVQEHVHVKHQRKGHSLIKLLALPRPIVQRESLQLQGQNLWQTVQTITFLCSHLVAAARALVRIVPLECSRAEVLKEGLFDGLIGRRLFKLVHNG